MRFRVRELARAIRRVPWGGATYQDTADRASLAQPCHPSNLCLPLAFGLLGGATETTMQFHVGLEDFAQHVIVVGVGPARTMRPAGHRAAAAVAAGRPSRGGMHRPDRVLQLVHHARKAVELNLQGLLARRHRACEVAIVAEQPFQRLGQAVTRGRVVLGLRTALPDDFVHRLQDLRLDLLTIDDPDTLARELPLQRIKGDAVAAGLESGVDRAGEAGLLAVIGPLRIGCEALDDDTVITEDLVGAVLRLGLDMAHDGLARIPP